LHFNAAMPQRGLKANDPTFGGDRMSTLTLNKITAQRGIAIGEATKKIADLGWNPSYVQEAMTYPTDYKINKAPRDPMKQVLRSYFPMQKRRTIAFTARSMRRFAATCSATSSRAGSNG
jgi:uncharacterized protein with WD repeat